MNRAERRRAAKEVGKKGKSLADTKPPIPKNLEDQLTGHIQRWETEVRLEAANRSLNLTTSAFLVALHDKYDFDKEKLEEVLHHAFTHMECAWQGYITYEELMVLCEEFGIPSKDLNYENVNKSARDVQITLLEYERMKQMAVMKDKIYALLEAGETDINVIAKKVGTTKGSVSQFKYLWKKEKGKVTPDDLYDAIFEGEDPEEVEVVPDNKDTVPEKADIVPENKTEEEVEIMSERKKLKPISITLQGEFGTYAVENKVVTVKLDTSEMGLDKEKLQELIEELQEVQGQL